MTDADISYIIAHHKRKRVWADFAACFILLLPLAMGAIALIVLYFTIKNPQQAAPYPATRVYWGCIASLLPAGGLFYFSAKRLRQNITFTSIKTPFAKSKNCMLAIDIFRSMGYAVKPLPDYAVVTTRRTWLSWGEEITIIPLDGEILINSHPNETQPVTIVKDVRNIRQFARQVTQRIDAFKQEANQN